MVQLKIKIKNVTVPRYTHRETTTTQPHDSMNDVEQTLVAIALGLVFLLIIIFIVFAISGIVLGCTMIMDSCCRFSRPRPNHQSETLQEPLIDV